MKHKFFITILPLVTCIITSCSKDKPLDTSSNSVSATISIGNNAPFQFSATDTAVKFYPYLPGGPEYDLEAIDANNNELFIGFDNLTQTGTYSFTTNTGLIGTGSAFTFIKDIGSTSQLSYWTLTSIGDRGSVTITAFNSHHIEGTFTAFCKNENNTDEVAQVSSGSFKVNY